MKKKIETPKYIFDYNIVFMNVLAFVILGIMVLITWGILYLSNVSIESVIDKTNDFTFMIFIILMFVWFFIHEFIHGISYILNGAHKENVTYGAALEKGVFYCKCGEFIDKKNIMISVIAPFTIIGVITYVIGFIIKSPILVALSITNIVGASGDLMMFIFFLGRDKDIKFKELGDSTRFCLETKEDLSKKKFIGVKLAKVVEDEKEIKEEKQPLITVSKESKVALIFFTIIIVILILLTLLTNMLK